MWNVSRWSGRNDSGESAGGSRSLRCILRLYHKRLQLITYVSADPARREPPRYGGVGIRRARPLFDSGLALGRHLVIDRGTPLTAEVVGVVGDARPFEPAVLVAVGAGLAALGMLAMLVPARRPAGTANRCPCPPILPVSESPHKGKPSCSFAPIARTSIFRPWGAPW